MCLRGDQGEFIKAKTA